MWTQLLTVIFLRLYWFKIYSGISLSSMRAYLYLLIGVLYQKSFMSRVMYLDPSIDMVLLRYIFTVVMLKVYDYMFPL